jgi:hypothetical protein
MQDFAWVNGTKASAFGVKACVNDAKANAFGAKACVNDAKAHAFGVKACVNGTKACPKKTLSSKKSTFAHILMQWI